MRASLTVDSREPRLELNEDRIEVVELVARDQGLVVAVAELAVAADLPGVPRVAQDLAYAAPAERLAALRPDALPVHPPRDLADPVPAVQHREHAAHDRRLFRVRY